MSSKKSALLQDHPAGLWVLFFTEFWERFSYYGMRAFLVFFMTAPALQGGLGFSTEKAAEWYGWYTSSVYATCIVGGFLADRMIGQFRSVLWGGAIIAAGHFTLAIHNPSTFLVGLVLIIVGTGLLKPNVSTLVGSLYDRNDPRRDSAFSIFYMGINSGALLGPLVAGTLAESKNFGWHWGFSAAGIGMVLGLVVLSVFKHWLLKGIHGAQATKPLKPSDLLKVGAWLVGLAVAVTVLPSWLVWVALIVLCLVSFVPRGGDASPLTKDEWKRMGAAVTLFAFAAIFWSAFEQAGSSLNFFAQRLTDRSWNGSDFPASWFQSLNPFFIITCAPIMAWLWVKLGKKQPSSGSKFAWGLLLVGLGFLVLVPVSPSVELSNAAAATTKAGPGWLLGVYFLHTIGELCLSPVGLSATTKLAPQRMVGMMMGLWFLAASMGNKLGGYTAGFFEKLPLNQLFFGVFATATVAALIAFALSKPLKRLAGD